MLGPRPLSAGRGQPRLSRERAASPSPRPARSRSVQPRRAAPSTVVVAKETTKPTESLLTATTLQHALVAAERPGEGAAVPAEEQAEPASHATSVEGMQHEPVPEPPRHNPMGFFALAFLAACGDAVKGFVSSLSQAPPGERQSSGGSSSKSQATPLRRDGGRIRQRQPVPPAEPLPKAAPRGGPFSFFTIRPGKTNTTTPASQPEPSHQRNQKQQQPAAPPASEQQRGRQQEREQPQPAAAPAAPRTAVSALVEAACLRWEQSQYEGAFAAAAPLPPALASMVDAAMLQQLMTALQTPELLGSGIGVPSPERLLAFYDALWEQLKATTLRSCSTADCFEAGRVLLREAEATLRERHAGQWSSEPLQGQLWKLKRDVHVDTFNVVAGRLKAPLPPGLQEVKPSAEAGSPRSANGSPSGGAGTPVERPQDTSRPRARLYSLDTSPERLRRGLRATPSRTVRNERVPLSMELNALSLRARALSLQATALSAQMSAVASEGGAGELVGNGVAAALPLSLQGSALGLEAAALNLTTVGVKGAGMFLTVSGSGSTTTAAPPQTGYTDNALAPSDMGAWHSDARAGGSASPPRPAGPAATAARLLQQVQRSQRAGTGPSILDSPAVRQLGASPSAAPTPESGPQPPASASFPDTSQLLLLWVAAFNRRCASSWRRAPDRYTVGAPFLDAVAGPALAALQVHVPSAGQLRQLLSALAQLVPGTGWRPSRELVAGLDAALATAAEGEPLRVLARLLALRADVAGPLPMAANLAQVVNDSVLMSGRGRQAGRLEKTWPDESSSSEEEEQGQEQSAESSRRAAEAAAAAEAASLSDETAAVVDELRALSCLLDMAAKAKVAVAGDPLLAPAAVKVVGTAWLDADLLFSKVHMSLAMAGPELWTSHDFLCRVYPRLMASSRLFEQRSEDLLLERYAAAISEQILQLLEPRPAALAAAAAAREQLPVGTALPAPSAATLAALVGRPASLLLHDVDTLCAVLDVLRDAPTDVLDARWRSRFQHHCSRLLSGGLRHGYVRRSAWLALLQAMGDMSRRWPDGWQAKQLCSTLAIALAHGSAPFGHGNELRDACAAWLKLADGSGLQQQQRAKVAVGGSAGSVAGRASVAVVVASTEKMELPGVGWVEESVLERCLELGGGEVAGVAVPSAADWQQIIANRLDHQPASDT